LKVKKFELSILSQELGRDLEEGLSELLEMQKGMMQL
jgi:hypothetical protein